MSILGLEMTFGTTDLGSSREDLFGVSFMSDCKLALEAEVGNAPGLELFRLEVDALVSVLRR